MVAHVRYTVSQFKVLVLHERYIGISALIGAAIALGNENPFLVLEIVSRVVG